MFGYRNRDKSALAKRQIDLAHSKVLEHLQNGSQLGWLLNPENIRVYVYYPGKPEILLEDPETISGDPVLAGFASNIREFGRQCRNVLRISSLSPQALLQSGKPAKARNEMERAFQLAPQLRSLSPRLEQSPRQHLSKR